MKIFSFLPDLVSAQNKMELIARTAEIEYRTFESREALTLALAKVEPRTDTFVITGESEIEFVKDLSAVHPDCQVVIILTTPLQKLAKHVLDCLSVKCFVATQNNDFDARDMQTLIKKFKKEDYQGLERHLCFGTDISSQTVTDWVSKNDLINQVEGFVQSLGTEAESRRFTEYSRRVAELTDELVLNAIFDANPRLSEHDRSLQFNLASDELVNIRWGFDGDLFGISVTDPFGRLQKETILKYLDESYTKKDIHLQKSAGIGLKVVFERLHQLIVHVTPGKQTEIICLLRFDKRFRDFESRLRSFHYFASQQGEE